MDNFNLLSERLKWAIRHKERETLNKISQSDIAGLFHPKPLSRAAVSNWMTDKNQMDAKYARVIAKYLGVNELWLEANTGHPVDEHKSALKQNATNYVNDIKSSDPLNGLVEQMEKVFRAIPQADREILLLTANRLYSYNFPNDGIASGRKPKIKSIIK